MTQRGWVLLGLNGVAIAMAAGWWALTPGQVHTCAICEAPGPRPLQHAVRPTSPPAHRDDRLLEGAWTSAGAPVAGSGVVRSWSEEGVRRDWSVERTGEGVRWSIELETPVTYSQVRLGFRSGGFARLRVLPTSETPQGERLSEQLVRETILPPASTGPVDVLVPVIGGPPGNFLGWRHVSLAVEAVGDAAPDALRSVQLETPAATLALEVAIRTVDVSGERRPALVVPAGMSAHTPLSSAASLRLAFGVGGLEQPSGRVVLDGPRGSRTLWEGSAADWQSVVVDIAPAELPGTLRVESGGQGVFLLGDPRWLTAEPDPVAPDVLLYLVDTLRADRVGAWGYSAAVTPVLDRLSAEGVQFSRAQSVSAWTMPAVPSVLTGLAPTSHEIRLGGRGRLPAEYDVLAEQLSGAGWRTAAFTGSPLVLGGVGLDRGFETVLRPEHWLAELGPMGHPTAPQLHEALEEWIAARPDRPFFAYLQTMEVHEYYRDEVYGSVGRYDRSVAAADEHLGVLLRSLAELRDRPLIVVLVSDHGERLGERDGQFGHGLGLYQEEIHIPLVLWRSDVAWGGTIDHPVSNLDVAPTLLGLVGLPAMPHVDGVDLTPMLRPGREFAREPVLSRLVEFWWTPGSPERHALLDAAGIKRMHWAGGERFEVYDLAADPCESRGLGVEPSHRAALSDRMAAARAAAERHTVSLGVTEPAPVTVDVDEMEALEALGYVLPD